MLGRPRIDDADLGAARRPSASRRAWTSSRRSTRAISRDPVEDMPDRAVREPRSTTSLDRLREGHAEFHPIEGRAAAPGDFAVADIAGYFVEILAPGQSPRTFRDEKITLEVGHADSMPEINEALRGSVPGETRRFRKTFRRRLSQRGVPRQDRGLRGDARRAEGEAPAGGRRRRSRRSVGESETVEGLREKIRQSLRQEKEAERRRQVPPHDPRHAAVPRDDSGARGPGRVGDRGRAPRLRAVPGRERRRSEGGRLGAPAPGGAAGRREAGAEYLLLDAIADREGVEVTETELEAEFKRTAARRGADPAALREQLAKAGGLDALRDEMRLSKAVDLLISAARVLPSGEPVEVK